MKSLKEMIMLEMIEADRLASSDKDRDYINEVLRQKMLAIEAYQKALETGIIENKEPRKPKPKPKPKPKSFGTWS